MRADTVAHAATVYLDSLKSSVDICKAVLVRAVMTVEVRPTCQAGTKDDDVVLGVVTTPCRVVLEGTDGTKATDGWIVTIQRAVHMAEVVAIFMVVNLWFVLYNVSKDLSSFIKIRMQNKERRCW